MKRIVPITMLMLLLMAMFSLTLNIKSTKAEWIGTVYIRADGSIDPPTAPMHRMGDVYTLTGDIISNNHGIVVERDNIVVDGAGYTVQGTGAMGWAGIYLNSRSNVTIKNTRITTFYLGIYLRDSSNNSVSGNHIISNNQGISIDFSNSNNISGNSITNNNWGISLGASSNNDISVNIIINNTVGIYLTWYENHNNKFWHNNFIDNTQQCYNMYATSISIWDDGYPSGGNFWSDYNGTDLNGDGIGDVAYIIDANNKDRYPLIFPIVWNYSNPVPIVWEGKIYSVAISSNSTVSGFKINQPQMQISFNVSGSSGTFGYCNVTIPKSLLRDNPWIITIDGQPPINIITTSNDTHSFLYFTYIHGNIKTVTIKGTHVISEYPLTIILTICTFTTTILVVLTKKGRLFMPRH
jgi:parallel beta-helix repeat protein